MDRETNKDEESIIDADLRTGLKSIIDYIESQTNTTIADIDKRLKSLWTRGATRETLILARGVLMMLNNDEKLLLHTAFLLEDIRKRMAYLEMFVQGIAKKLDIKVSKELENLREQIEEEKGALANIEPYIDVLRKAIEERRKWLDENR